LHPEARRRLVQAQAAISFDALLAAQAVEDAVSGQAPPPRRAVTALRRTLAHVDRLVEIDEKRQFALLMGTEDAPLDDFEPYHLVARATTTRPENGNDPSLSDSAVLTQIVENRKAIEVTEEESIAVLNEDRARLLFRALDRLARAATAAAYAEDASQRGHSAVV
jgi:hypothetical protein